MKGIKASPKQLNTLKAMCRDLSHQLKWHGRVLHEDDWRHLICAAVLGQTIVRGIDMGEGERPRLVALGGSSKGLTRDLAMVAIDLALSVGNHPESQGINAMPVSWTSSGASLGDDMEDSP